LYRTNCFALRNLFCTAENAGLAAAVAALYQAKNYANSAAVGLWDASYADVLALGSLLAMARCDGPQVRIPIGRLEITK
jgi:hypothetical protein